MSVKDPGKGGTGVATEDRVTVQRPKNHKVLLHNDDYTTMEFVIMILERVFDKDIEEATRIMLNVHHEGVGLAGQYTKEIAETKAKAKAAKARKKPKNQKEERVAAPQAQASLHVVPMRREEAGQEIRIN